MAGYWLPGATKLDLSDRKGYGPLRTPKLGGVLHCNQSRGRLEAYVSRPSTEVCPTFQVYEVGPPTQFLPMDWQPVCQSAGNQNYFAVETEGYGVALPGHAATALNENQLEWCARIFEAAHRELSMPLKVAEKPGQAGIGWHGMGGNSWGGHDTCPGVERRAQRQTIIDLITAPEEDMTPDQAAEQAEIARQTNSIYEAIFYGGTSMPDADKSMGQSLADLRALVNGKPSAAQIATAVVAVLPPSGGGTSGPGYSLDQLADAFEAVINKTHLSTSGATS